MITVVSPRIHNLGDFAHCLPVLSGLYKYTGHKIWFVLCDRLQRFKGLKELLMYQGFFEKITFLHEGGFDFTNAVVVDDTGSDDGYEERPVIQQRYLNYFNQQCRTQIQPDDDFELIVPKFDINYHEKKLIVGDRWSPKDAPDVDTRRNFNVIQGSDVLKHNSVKYLEYTQDLVYNCSLIKYNPNPFITTITGIAILADLMKKDFYLLWDDDMKIWQGSSIENEFNLHYYKNRGAKLTYIKTFIYENQAV